MPILSPATAQAGTFYNHALEEAVLRALLTHPQQAALALRYGDYDDFMDGPDAGLLWKALRRCARGGRPIDREMIKDAAVRELRIPESRVEPALSRVVSAAESDRHLEAWLGELRTYWRRRRQRRLPGDLEAQLAAGKGPDEVAAYVAGVLQDTSAVVSAEGLHETTLRRIEEIDLYRTAGVLRSGLLTGIAELDHAINGLKKSHLFVVAARPECGKTSLALQIADYVLSTQRATAPDADSAAPKRPHRVMIITLEMSPERLIDRWLTLRTGIPFKKIDRAELSDEEYTAVATEGGEIARWGRTGQLVIYSQANFPGRITAREITQAVIAEHAKDPLDLVIIDYFQLYSGSERVEADEASKETNRISKSLGVATLLLCQLSRENIKSDRAPRVEDLRNTGQIEQDADIVLLMDRKDRRVDRQKWVLQDVVEDTVDFDVAKGRDSGHCQFSRQFAGEVMTFLQDLGLVESSRRQEVFEDFPGDRPSLFDKEDSPEPGLFREARPVGRPEGRTEGRPERRPAVQTEARTETRVGPSAQEIFDKFVL